MPHRHYQIVMISLIYHQIFDHLCNHSFSLIRTIICGDIQIADFFHLFFQDYQIFRLRSHNCVCLNTVLMQPFYLRIYRSCSHTSGNKQDFFLFQFFRIFVDQLGGLSQRSRQNPGKHLLLSGLRTL